MLIYKLPWAIQHFLFGVMLVSKGDLQDLQIIDVIYWIEEMQGIRKTQSGNHSLQCIFPRNNRVTTSSFCLQTEWETKV